MEKKQFVIIAHFISTKDNLWYPKIKIYVFAWGNKITYSKYEDNITSYIVLEDAVMVLFKITLNTWFWKCTKLYKLDLLFV